MIPKHTVIQYVRNKKRIPYGVLVAIKDDNGYRVGYSLCNKKDRFNKAMALKIAIGRAYRGHEIPTPIPHDVPKTFKHNRMLSNFNARCKKYYQVS